MSDRESFTARQEKYAEWRDRLRDANDMIDLDAVAEPVEDPWSTEAMFRASAAVIEADSVDADS